MTEIKEAICTLCDEKEGYSNDIYCKLEEKYKLLFSGGSLADLPTSHPLWLEFDQLLRPNKELCLVYNDEYALCQAHLTDKLMELKEQIHYATF